VASLGGRGTLGRIEVKVAVARVDRRRAARRTRFVDKQTAAWGRIALIWVRKRCYEPTEPPRTKEKTQARLRGRQNGIFCGPAGRDQFQLILRP